RNLGASRVTSRRAKYSRAVQPCQGGRKDMARLGLADALREAPLARAQALDLPLLAALGFVGQEIRDLFGHLLQVESQEIAEAPEELDPGGELGVAAALRPPGDRIADVGLIGQLPQGNPALHPQLDEPVRQVGNVLEVHTINTI